MQRTVLSSALVATAVLAGTATAHAADFSGRWTANISKSSYLELTLKTQGSSYTGTYSYVTTFKVKSVTKTAKSTQPVTATFKVGSNKIPTITLRFIKTKPVITSQCALVKSQLRCVSPATQKAIVFSKSK